MELPISDLRADMVNADGVDIITADSVDQVLEFTVRYLQAHGLVLMMDNKIILPGSVRKADKGVV